MKVFLTVGTKPPVEFDSKKPISRPLKVRAWDIVKAKICLDKDEVAQTEDDYVEFVIQTGARPDVRAVAEIESGKTSGAFLYKHKDKGKRKESNKFKLFQGTVGGTGLFVFNRYDSHVPEWKLTNIEVCDEVKGKLYDGMVGDILQMSLPHYVIDEFRWQMVRNKFSLRWRYGYTSYESEDVMLRILGRLIRRELEPNLREIARALQCKFIKRERLMPLSRVHRVNGVIRRNVVRLMSRRSIESIDDIESGKVLALASEATTDIPAHEVIRTFLEQFVLYRLDIIEKSITSRLQKTKKDMQSYRNDATPYKINKWAEAKAEFESCGRKLRLVDELRSRVIPFLTSTFLSAAKHDCDVFNVDAGEFEATINYRRLYVAMLEYSRTCFWWTSDDSNKRTRIPQVQLSCQGETRLQTKYSIVYENWCYARMLSAMNNLGFVLQENRNGEQANGEGAVCIYKKNGTTVKVMHGIVALTKEDCEFYLTDQGRHQLTPDFAIVISAQGVNNDCWIVADAKSYGRLDGETVDKRNGYASKILRHGKIPMASVLFRSGDSDNDLPFAEIEMPPPPVEEWAETDEHNPEEVKNDHSSDDYRWRSGYGVVPGSKPATTYHGHVRANISTLGTSGRIFEEFMDGMIKTALRRIGAIPD